MSSPRAIVSGASIAGLSTAFWLGRAGWEVTTVEQAPTFRDGGQNVDVRGVAREVIDRMGLLDAVRDHNTTETGTVTVDADGGVIAELPSDGSDGATAELEILRGDLARLIADALPTSIESRYGETISAVTDASDAVRVTTSSGDELSADLLVVAEGVRSRTRDLIFGDAVTHHRLGITMAFGTIPRIADDDDRWRWYNATEGRQVHLRPDPYGTIRAILAFAPSGGLADRELSDATREFRTRFADAGWQAERVLNGFDRSEDLYVDDLEQIHMARWSEQRSVLVGDSAWCVTPIGGGGASLALTGGYVLAAYLSSGRPQAEALSCFEEWMRPLVDEVQKLPPGVQRIAYPQTRLGLTVRHLADKALSSAPLRPLAERATQVADSERELPPLRS